MTNFTKARERRHRILRSFQRGVTIRQLSFRLGVSESRVRQLTLLAEAELRAEKEWYPGVSVRVVNCMRNGGFMTKQEVIAGVRTGAIKPGKVKNFGKKSFLELLKGLDVEPPTSGGMDLQ